MKDKKYYYRFMGYESFGNIYDVPQGYVFKEYTKEQADYYRLVLGMILVEYPLLK